MFAQFGNERSSNKLLTLAGTTSTSMILITADKKPRIIIQRRGMRNSAYIDVPGASASGYLDSIPFQKSQDGKASNDRRSLRPLTTSDLRDNVLRELGEELGIKKEDISEVINTAIVHSATNANNDFAFIATTNLTASEVRRKAKHAKDNIKLHPEEFREKFVDIEASPEAILTLVTKVQCPIPPTHTAALIAAGYSIMLDLEMSELVEKGSSDRYREEIAAGVKKNYEEIDAKVRKFYSDNPNMLEDIPQRIKDRIETAIEVFKAENPNSSESSVKVFRESQIELILPRDPKGFSPNYTPEEQGLLDFESAMKKVRLIA